MSEYESSVHLCSPFNSTTFTTCCNVAICDHQRRCPQCDKLVEGDNGAERWSAAKRNSPEYYYK